MFDFETKVREALAVLKGVQSTEIIIEGKNKDIEMYYDIWRGVPNWLDYKYWLPKGEYKESKLKTLNMPRYLCRYWANNYANEDTAITIPDDKSNERLQEIFAVTNLFGRFNNFVEMFMGLGIGAMTVETEALMNEDGTIAKSDGEPKIKLVPGRRVIPITVDDGEVTECAFVSLVTGGARLTIHYLVDGKYHLAVFKGKVKDGNYNFDLNNYTDIPLDTIPLFQIWHPNVTDEDELDKSVGTSIFATALDVFKHLDLGYTAYYKEVKLGQKVKFLSNDTIDFGDDGNPIYPFDEDDESILFIKDATDAGTKMQEFNGELRIDAITKYINTNLNCAAMLCGLGQTQFEFDGGGGRPIQTATGVIAKQTELYRNVIKQENLATAKFRQLVQAIAYVNNTFLNKPEIKIDKLTDIVVTYDDNVVEDTETKKQAELNEVNAGVMSIAEFRSHWYDEDYESALQFVQDNGLLLDKYTLALQSKVITPEMFVTFVFGEEYEHFDELVAYIKENMMTQEQTATGFDDESNNNDNADEDDKKEEPKDDNKDDE